MHAVKEEFVLWVCKSLNAEFVFLFLFVRAIMKENNKPSITIMVDKPPFIGHYIQFTLPALNFTSCYHVIISNQSTNSDPKQLEGVFL